jgi:Putative metallopeptidase domain
MPPKPKRVDLDPATRQYRAAVEILRAHPVFAPLMARAHLVRDKGNSCPDSGWAIVTDTGYIHVHPTRRGEPDEWVYVLAHCLLHHAFDHFHKERRLAEWNAACDVIVTRFLSDMKLGRPPEELRPYELPAGTEHRLYDTFCATGIPEHVRTLSPGGSEHADLFYAKQSCWEVRHARSRNDWQVAFAFGLRQAVRAAVDVAAGRTESLSAPTQLYSPAQRARSWFISSYPLLGAMIAAFEIVEDSGLCMREDIGVAAVNAHTKEVFINPGIGLTEQECRFVIAHEILHVGLSHNHRCDGRDPYLWNVACDFVVNGWLVEMGIGTLPQVGGLYDPELKGLSSEDV